MWALHATIRALVCSICVSNKQTIFWFRRDLRLNDNAGLYRALRSGGKVQPLFIFDKNILDKLENKSDARVQFIHEVINDLAKELQLEGASLLVKYGDPVAIWKELIAKGDIEAVFTNRDYEPYALKRDKTVYRLLEDAGIPFKGFKDQVIFDKNEVLKKDGKPYTVFSPYAKVWRAKLNDYFLKSYPVKKYFPSLYASKQAPIPSLKKMGFQKSTLPIPSLDVEDHIIKKYGEQRDFPGIRSTSKLGIHLRFGTISIRELGRRAQKLSFHFLNELTWRDFYHMIIYHWPHAAENSFKPAYDRIPWINDEQQFAAWCKGETGYPMVDAGMRELNATGFMHNRVRMITASFLVKHLLIDWRWGERYFANKLLDFDLAANNGGWQWAASSGCDAAPYFRIFNPALQFKRFDKEAVYVRKWVPEYGTDDYPDPIVEHKMARLRAIETFKQTLKPPG